MEPTVYVAPPPAPASGNAVQRGLRAIFVEHRLPGPLQSVADRVALKMGRRLKTVDAGGFRVTMRRDDEDHLHIANIIDNQMYTSRPGFAIEPDNTVIDIGANIGTFTLTAARAAQKGRVIAVEPVLENFELLRRNVRQNALTNVQIIHAAAMDKSGVTPIYLNEQFGGCHSTRLRQEDPEATNERLGSALRVDKCELTAALTLSDLFDYLKIDRCHFLKLDCEGAEFPILFGLPDAVFQRIDRIVMEYHATTMSNKREEGAALVRHLEMKNFKIDAYLDYEGFRCGGIWAKRT
jgi:FkbM family methyltransferase